jgi:photosystem II stability/assembly factor-like uncharacterized protein
MKNDCVKLFWPKFIIALCALISIIVSISAWADSPVDIPPNWQRIGPYGSEDLFALQYSFQNPGFVAFATFANVYHVFKSCDSGRTYEPIYFPTIEVNEFAVSSDNTDIMLLATGFDGSFRTSDGGLNWESIAMDRYHAPVFAPSDGSYVYLAEGDQVQKSTDAGISWQTVVLPDRYAERVYVDPYDPLHVIGCQGVISGYVLISRLYVSYDGAENWEYLALDNANLIEVLYGKSPGSLYAAGYHDVWKSTDCGYNWQCVYTEFPDEISQLAISCVPDEILYICSYADAFNDPTDNGMYRSSDGGAEWESLKTGWEYITCGPICPDPSDNLHIVAQADGGPFSTYDGGVTWFLPDSSVPGHRIQILAASPLIEGLIFAATNGVVVRTTDFGATWTPSNCPAYSWRQYWRSIAFSMTDRGKMYIAYWNYTKEQGGVIKSTDAGERWEDHPITDFALNKLALKPDDDNMILGGAGNGKICRSIDGGESWSIVYDSGNDWESFPDIEFMPLKTTKIYALRENGATEVITLLKSTDSGATWQEVSTLPTIAASDLAISYNDPEVIYECSGQKIMRSDDQGLTWKILPFPEWQPIDYMATTFRHPSWIWVIDGFKLSTDFGETWKVIERPANGPDTGLLVGDDANPGIFFVTNDGVWIYPDGVHPQIMIAGVTTHQENGQNIIHFRAWPTDLEGNADIQEVKVLYDGIDTGLRLFDDGSHGDTNTQDGIFELQMTFSSIGSEMLIPWSLIAVDHWGFQSEIWPKIAFK